MTGQAEGLAPGLGKGSESPARAQGLGKEQDKERNRVSLRSYRTGARGWDGCHRHHFPAAFMVLFVFK